MARNALMPQMQMYDAPAGLDVSNLTNPLMQGMQSYRQGMQQQFEGDRALFAERRQGEQLQLAKNADGRAAAAQRAAQEKSEVERLGKLAQVIADDPNDATASQRWQGVIQSNPQMGTLLEKYGVDPRDHRTGAKFLMAEVGTYKGQSEREADRLKMDMGRAQLGKVQAETKALGQKDALAEAQARMLGQLFPQPNAAPQSPIRPQSFAPSGDPMLVPTQAGGAPVQQPAPDMIDTPGGRMPREQAQRLGLSLALTGKGDAGKMFADAASAGNLGKEGQNELDKKMIAASDNLANLSSVRAQFRPEFQQVENRLGMAWTAFADKFKAGQRMIKPEDAAQLEAFAAYRSDALDTMNNYIKAITGAAMTDAEAKRILGALPAVGEGVFDGDGPKAFKSKLDSAFDKTSAAIARYNYARQNGKDWQMIGIEQMKTVVRNRGRQLEQEILRANPNLDRSALPAEVTKQIKREFGI